MTHTEFLKLLEERPLRMAPQPEPETVALTADGAHTNAARHDENRRATGAAVFLTALVFWTVYCLMQRLSI